MSRFDDAFAFARVVSTALSTSAKQVLVSLAAFKDGASDDPADNEGTSSEPLFGAIGVFSRPRDADADGAAEVVAARTEDGMQPLVGRDLRIVKARGNVAKGSISLAGYGGGFLTIEDTAAKTSSIVMVYAPFPGSPAPHAHALALDTTAGNESVVLAHGLGQALVLAKDKSATIKNAAGDGFISCNDKGVTISGDVSCTNNVLVGDQSDPLIQGVMLSTQLLVWIAQVNVALTAIGVLLNAPGAVVGVPGTVTPPVAVPVSTTKIQATPG